MKAKIILPVENAYLQIESKSGFQFEDRQTSAFRIKSPVPDPWKKEWVVLFSAQKQKSDSGRYPYRLDLKLFHPSEEYCQPAELVRDRPKGVFVACNAAAIATYVFPENSGRVGVPHWVVYTVLPRSSQA